MEKLSQIQKLNYALDLFVKREHVDIKQFEVIIRECSLYQGLDKDILINKLLKDGFIGNQSVLNRDSYIITFEGNLFYENGGYAAYYNSKRINKKNKIIFSAILSFAGLIASYYYISQFFCFYPLFHRIIISILLLGSWICWRIRSQKVYPQNKLQESILDVNKNPLIYQEVRGNGK